MEKKCGCKGSKGKNYIPGRITLDLDGKEVSNRDLVCRDCTYKKRSDTLSCLLFEQKPEAVLGGEACEKYLRDGSKLSGKKSGCSDCGECGGCR